MKKQGYTLIELIASLAILSMILAIGIMKFNVIDKIKADTEIQTMINDINHAKESAMITGNSFELKLREDSYTLKSKNTISRNLRYIKINTGVQKEITINYNVSGSSDNARTIQISSQYGNQKKLEELKIGVAGGLIRIE